MNPLTQSKNTTILPVLITLTFACLALPPTARGSCQQGCLTNGNTVLGDDALLNNTGTNNTAIGFDALLNNTTGFFNTALGANALNANTVGIDNTAIGNQALFFNTTGGFNTALGHAALQANTSGESNTAIGWAALAFNVTGGGNTAVGDGALIANTGGGSNTAVGNLALSQNTTANFNTATGTAALQANDTGSNNAAYGFDALQLNTTGSNNTAVGSQALRLNKPGDNNTCLGNSSLYKCKGNNNIAVGAAAGSSLTMGSNNIDIGNNGDPGESNTIRIGKKGTHTNTFIAGISGVTVAGGVGVIIDTNGHLGTVVSSERFKDNVQPMDKASEAILALKPVTFRYKKEFDPDGIPQFGLVAEQVEKVNPNLVARDADGRPYTVRYEAVNAMLLNEFLKARRQIDAQQKQIDALTEGLQKVSAQIEASKSAPQVVNNP
jgi:hypothetical protein